MDRKTTALIAFICAVAVGNLYYAQPVLVQIAQTFAATPSAVGIVATLAQVGYGLGVLLIVPLGDVLERRRLVVALLCSVAVAMALAGLAPSLPLLAVANFLVGMTTITPQILIPYAATLASAAQRATSLGTIQSGLLVGILLARTFAGGVAALAGWRSVYFVGASLSLVLAGVVYAALPRQAMRQQVSYRQLLLSMWQLLRALPTLRRVSVASGLNFAAFSAFWTTLAFLLDEVYHLGPAVVGLFGIVGVAGALGASASGYVADRYGPEVAQKTALWLTVLSFGVFFAAPHAMVALVLGVVLMDAGVQAGHLAFQAEVFSLQADARSRLNGLYMFFRFVGGAVGSLVGAWSWHHGHWNGVCLAGLAFAGAAVAVSGRRRLLA